MEKRNGQVFAKEPVLAQLPNWKTDRDKYNTRCEAIRKAIKKQNVKKERSSYDHMEVFVAERVTGLTDFGEIDIEMY